MWIQLVHDKFLVDPWDHEGRAEDIHDRAGLPADPPAWFAPPRLIAYEIGYALCPEPDLRIPGYELHGVIHYRPTHLRRRGGEVFLHEIIEGESRREGLICSHGDIYRGELSLAFPWSAMRRLERTGRLTVREMARRQPFAPRWLLGLRLIGYRNLLQEYRLAV